MLELEDPLRSLSLVVRSNFPLTEGNNLKTKQNKTYISYRHHHHGAILVERFRRGSPTLIPLLHILQPPNTYLHTHTHIHTPHPFVAGGITEESLGHWDQERNLKTTGQIEHFYFEESHTGMLSLGPKFQNSWFLFFYQLICTAALDRKPQNTSQMKHFTDVSIFWVSEL